MTNSTRVSRIVSREVADCQTCHLRALCVPQGLPLKDIAELNGIAPPLAPLKKHDALFRQGMPFTSLFAVRSGSLKQVTTTYTNEHLVTGFFLPGDLVGLDAIAEECYPGSAVALETTTVCELPFERLNELSLRIPALRQRIYRDLSQEVHNERLMQRLLLNRTAEARLARFLLTMSASFRRRGYSPYRFQLAMTRGDIGNYLGLSLETVSRTLTRYQQHELVVIRGHDFHLCDMKALTRLSEACGRQGAAQQPS
ncbi:fumarate/nitrate reduction transcriptional regulator Fnr [Litchfieldella rifensis]|uniref:Fumarate/nitrate reduction transcriptional regulator Fnr n=1 Tax=Litchfieldella rifensis TaxID=762643 RepID=A0ABV7LJZ2_9GAMM